MYTHTLYPEQNLSVEDSVEDGWMTGIKNIKTSFKLIHLVCPLSTALEGKIERDDLVHFVVTARATYQQGELCEEHDEQRDRAGDLPEIKRPEYPFDPRGTPSQGAQSTEYPALQADPYTAIHDGRYPPNPMFPTVAPPLEIFHPVFAGFLHLVRDDNVQPTNQDMGHVRELFYYAAMVSSVLEELRNAEIRERLRKILQLLVYEFNTDETSADGVHMITANHRLKKTPECTTPHESLSPPSARTSNYCQRFMRRSAIPRFLVLPNAPPSPPRPKNAPAGLAIGFMQMLVNRFGDVLSILHAEGYVFGDLREPNVLFNIDNKIKLIDFNWCGRYDMDVEVLDLTIPADIQQKINESKGGFPRLSLNEYAHYPSNLSMSIEWPAGVEPLKPILPQHDWAMWDKIWS